MTIQESLDQIKSRLTPIVGESEAKAMANIILEDVKGYTSTQLFINYNRELLNETVERIHKIVDRIIAGEPMQYALGLARFRGRDFKVSPAVLIPRPETAQLTDWIIKEWQNKKDCKILDIGTGSGCIAISLALDIPFAEVHAIDISQNALLVAQENASKFKAKVDFAKVDIFDIYNSPLRSPTFDIIVSNPPYILESEKSNIESRVKDFEPANALFVKDSQPINIYLAIAQYAIKNLNANGKLYLEINPLCKDLIYRMLLNLGFTDVRIERDFKGNYRFATASRPR